MLLEEELEVQLMDRSSRKVVLTEAGQLLYLRARDILDMVDTALTDVKSLKSRPGGILRPETISSSGNLLIHHFLQR